MKANECNHQQMLVSLHINYDQVVTVVMFGWANGDNQHVRSEVM